VWVRSEAFVIHAVDHPRFVSNVATFTARGGKVTSCSSGQPASPTWGTFALTLLLPCVYVQVVYAPAETNIVAARDGTGPANDDFHVHIRQDDFVMPICHEGMNRSQACVRVFRGVPRVVSHDTCGACADPLCCASWRETCIPVYWCGRAAQGVYSPWSRIGV